MIYTNLENLEHQDNENLIFNLIYFVSLIFSFEFKALLCKLFEKYY
jgi:hypothetical protein